MPVIARTVIHTSMRVRLLGMFPYMMLATTPLFYGYDWPRRALSRVTRTKPGDNSAPQSDTATAAPDDDATVDNSSDAVDGGDEISRNTAVTNTASKVCK